MQHEPSPRPVDRPVERALSGLSLGDGRDYIGEPVTQLEHALQCAALARAANAPADEILAALFHDIGHLVAPAGSAEMDGLGIVDHEDIGAAWLAALGFHDSVCELVRSHVQAKRYLTLRKPGYAARMSEASRGTLAFQGGPMSEAEAERFERDPLFAAKVRLRSWDEAAKHEGKEVDALASYAGLIREHLEQQR
jgi:2-amino-1-hydroxyethylphosphonate dioxygenase (glycine-forming)